MYSGDRGRNKQRDQSSRDKSRSKSKSNYKNLECHHCGKNGHIKKFCYKWKRENKGQSFENKQEKKDGVNNERVAAAANNDIIIVYDDNMVNFSCHQTTWVINSGASLHVTSKKEFFTSYTSGGFGVLKIGNDGLAQVVGK